MYLATYIDLIYLSIYLYIYLSFNISIYLVYLSLGVRGPREEHAAHVPRAATALLSKALDLNVKFVDF